MKILERNYTNPYLPNGHKKPNKDLGNFKILRTISKAPFQSERLARKEGEYYLLVEFEISSSTSLENEGSKTIAKPLTRHEFINLMYEK